MNHDRPAASTSLRPIGLPRALAVQAGADGMPITVARADGRGRPGTPVPVEQVDDVWRIAEAWWRDAPQARTYYRVLLAGGIRQNSYLSVPADSQLTSVKDLRGKKVAVFKGTNIQLAVARILEAHGLTEKELRAISMNTPTTKAALVTRDIEAAFGGVRGYPTSILIDRDGTIRHRVVGPIAPATLEPAVRRLLK